MGVRRLRGDEWRELRALRISALDESPGAFGSTASSARRQDDADWQAWAQAGARSRSTALFVAVEGGTIVGLCGSFLRDDDPGTAQIVAMWVEPAARGRGLGRELLGAAAAWSGAAGARELALDVTETNLSARRLYRKAGFRETGGTAPLRSNGSLLTLEMRKPLRTPVA